MHLQQSTRHRSPWLSTAQLMSISLLGLIPVLNTASADERSETPETLDDSGVTDLEEVLIKGEGESAGEPETRLPLGVGVSGKTLRTTPGAAGDPLRALQSLPGFNFADDEEASPAVRGSRPDDNLFLVDFLPAGYLFHAGGVISVFNSELVESFDIYASAYGPEYSGGTGGVFDVRLRDPASDRLHGTLDMSVLQAGLLVEGPVGEDQSFYLAGRRSYLDLLVQDQLEDDEEGVTIVEFPNYSDYQGKYLWNIDADSSLRFQFNGATDRLELNIDEDSEEIEDDPVLAGRIADATEFHSQALVYEARTVGDASVKTALARQNATSRTQVGGAGRISIDVTDLQWKSQVSIPAGTDHELGLGLDLVRTDADIDLSFNAPACSEFEPGCFLTGADRLEVKEPLRINSAHVFLKDTWYLNEAFTLIPGVSFQAEDYLDGYSLEPRMALEYALADDLLLSAAAGLYHQLPSFDEVNEVLGNPELNYIRSVQGSIGLEKTFERQWSLRTELYYKDLSNLVAGDETTRFNNDGRGWAYGLEALVRKDLTDKFSGWLSLSLARARRREGTEGPAFAFDYDQPFNASLVASYEPSQQWRFGAKLWAHSGAPFTPVTGAEEDPDNPGFYVPQFAPINSDRLPSFARLDVRIDREFQLANGREFGLYFEVLNLLDRENLSYYDYSADYTEREQVSQLPRIIGIGVRATY